ncbi:hypothetical protein ACFVTX_18180 [Agromyces sp. NPDC058136]|uniref:hypothetical protein n=1 Tax=Agromyces sp. NPDC058136 TaxID=3346354 RepID=UPI0036DA331F
MAESKAQFEARRRQQTIEALEAELEGYKRYGNTKRAKDVNEQLAAERAALEAAGTARQAAAADGASTTPENANPYDGVSYRDLKQIAADRGITADGRSHQDYVDALTRADQVNAAGASGEQSTAGEPDGAPADEQSDSDGESSGSTGDDTGE